MSYISVEKLTRFAILIFITGFSHPQKSLKKVASRCRSVTDRGMPPTANELSHYINTCQAEYQDECRSEMFDQDEDNDDIQFDYESSRPMTATLSDFLTASNPWTKVKRKRRTTDDSHKNFKTVGREMSILGSGKQHRRGKGKALIVIEEEATDYGNTSKCLNGFSQSAGDCSINGMSEKETSDNSCIDGAMKSNNFDNEKMLQYFKMNTQCNNFGCVISNRQSIESLRSKWKNRFDESRSFPRIFLVDLTGSCVGDRGSTSQFLRPCGSRRRVFVIAKEFIGCERSERIEYRATYLR